MLDLKVLAEEIAAIVDERVAAEVGPLKAVNAELTDRLTMLENEAKPAPTIASLVAAATATLPPAKDGTSVTPADVQPVVDEAVARAVAALPPAKDGESADLDAINASIAKAVADLPVPKDGTSVTLADVEPLIVSAVERAVAALPPAKDGENADLDAINASIAKAVADLPVPKDGTSVTLADVQPVVDEAVARAVALLPAAKDGIGLAGAMIDRTGSLKITLSDGTITDLGPVEGKDGDPGLGFDDLTFEHDGERAFAFTFVRGDQTKSFPFYIPAVIDRGVFKDGQAYAAGDAVTFGGSLWIAQRSTGVKPDGADTGWRLAVKKGRDGRDGRGVGADT